MKPFYNKIANKIENLKEASDTVQKWKNEGLKVVFTNGCFDLIHLGHLYYIAEAASMGDKLIIAVNSDESVKRLKGPHRPIKDIKSRINLLASLQMVDLVVQFEEDTPLNIIKTLLPDVLVKGGDWKIKDIVGSDVVINNKGQVLSLSFLDGYSTTLLEKKIKNS